MSKAVAVVDTPLPQGEAILKPERKKAPYGLKRNAVLFIYIASLCARWLKTKRQISMSLSFGKLLKNIVGLIGLET